MKKKGAHDVHFVEVSVQVPRVESHYVQTFYKKKYPLAHVLQKSTP